MLLAARARVSLAQKAFHRHRRPARRSTASVAERARVGRRLRHQRHERSPSSSRVNPLRVQLTVPEQSVSTIVVGEPVVFEVDAYAGRQFNGTVK